MVALAYWLLLPIYSPIGELFMPYGGLPIQISKWMIGGNDIMIAIGPG
jgi:hypothetical protein